MVRGLAFVAIWQSLGFGGIFGLYISMCAWSGFFLFSSVVVERNGWHLPDFFSFSFLDKWFVSTWESVFFSCYEIR